MLMDGNVIIIKNSATLKFHTILDGKQMFIVKKYRGNSYDTLIILAKYKICFKFSYFYIY